MPTATATICNPETDKKSIIQDEQLQDDSMSIASEFLQCKAEFKEKHLKNIKVD